MFFFGRGHNRYLSSGQPFAHCLLNTNTAGITAKSKSNQVSPTLQVLPRGEIISPKLLEYIDKEHLCCWDTHTQVHTATTHTSTMNTHTGAYGHMLIVSREISE